MNTIEQLEADYLVIGAGAVSMAFVDTMLTETDASFVMVDRHHMPGGHWNDAYPFVRLHQPSAFYGVASRDLGSNRIDETGSNNGFYELASGAEVSAYFEQVMRQRFLPSGRVSYFPMCTYTGDGQFHSLMSSAEYDVSIRRKTVDGTFFNTSVPSTHQRKFDVAEGVTCVAPNELPRRAANHKQFTILGGGKTGMDAAVWLLDNGANPDSICWVCPRDSWLINRETTQPGDAFFHQAVGGFAAQLEAMRVAASVDDLFERLEAADVMFRIDPSTNPTMFHYATISRGEIDQLRRINNVIRMTRVSHIGPDQLVMASGEVLPADPEILYIDCTATAVQFTENKTQPVFESDLITLQALRAPLVTFSAAITAYAEANFDNDAEKNRLCAPVALADNPTEWMASFVGNMINQNNWSQNPQMRKWISDCRLDPFGGLSREAIAADPARAKTMASITENAVPAVMNLQKLIAEAHATG